MPSYEPTNSMSNRMPEDDGRSQSRLLAVAHRIVPDDFNTKEA